MEATYFVLFLACLGNELPSKESLGQQAEYLAATLCPTANRPTRCKAVVRAQWPRIGDAIFWRLQASDIQCSKLDGNQTLNRNIAKMEEKYGKMHENVHFFAFAFKDCQKQYQDIQNISC